MESYRGTARTIGILFIVASVTAVVGGSLVGLPLEESSYLVDLAGKDAAVITGALLLMIQAIAVVGIAVMFYPVLKRRNEGMALGFVGARIIESVLVVAGAVSALAVLSLSRGYGSEGSAGIAALGDTLVATYEWLYWLGPMLFFSVSALILYGILYRADLVPSWLSIWGFIGGVLLLARTVLEMYGVELSGAMQATLTAPIGANEMVLAIWLIARGFNPRPRFAANTEPAMPAA
jgi:hypothetical protein